MKTHLFTCACLMAFAGPAFGVNIAWVSFHGADDIGTPSAAAAMNGFLVAPDKGYTDLLISAGHTINRITVPPATPDVALTPALLSELNAADLVIIGRSVNSGSFQQAAETMSWNTSITKPMIITSPFITRGGALGGARLGYYTGETIPDTTGPTRVVAVNPTHPVFTGIPLDGSNETSAVLDIVTFNGLPQRGSAVATNPLATGGTVIASVTQDNPVTGARGGTMIAEWPAGAAGIRGEVFGSKRMNFFTGSRERDQASGDMAGILDLTTTGQQMFLNAVGYMTNTLVPLTPGDTDGDTMVELEDFNPIRDNFRKSVTARNQGDLVPNGRVDFADFRQWKTAFLGGGGSLEGVGISFAASVPEPATGALFVMAMVPLLGATGRGQIKRFLHEE